MLQEVLGRTMMTKKRRRRRRRYRKKKKKKKKRRKKEKEKIGLSPHAAWISPLLHHLYYCPVAGEPDF